MNISCYFRILLVPLSCFLLCCKKSNFPTPLPTDAYTVYGIADKIVYKKKSTDNSWTAYQFDRYTDINDIFFVNQNVGYLACAIGRIYKTIDGGNTWQLSNTNVSVNDVLSSVYLIGDTGFIGGVDGTGAIPALYSTIDGGQSWISIKDQLPIIMNFYNIASIFMVNDTVAYFAGNNGAYRTIDGTTSINYLGSTNGYNIKRIYFYNQDQGYMLDNLQGIYKTLDGGGSILPETMHIPRRQTIYDFFLPTIDSGYCLSFADDTTFLYKGLATSVGTDIAWKAIYKLPNLAMLSIYFTDKGVGYMSGESIYKTTDGGLT
ncbi:MAG: YCF48-related protein [Phycisphaerales bacterium]|nr:YCF48-related protein [Phycisphaerales bacterium]